MKITVTRNKRIAGYLDLRAGSHGNLEIAYIRVEPEFRGQRIGSQLLARAIKIADRESRLLVALLDPDGTGLTCEQERDWFKRNGFKRASFDFGGYNKWAMIR